jgi:hypothetical protein
LCPPTARDYPVPSNGVVQRELYSCKHPTECAIADTIRGTQENARQKKIRSQGEWLLQIAVFL